MMDRSKPGAATYPKLIFILSSERSGSTLLRVILGKHPQIVAPAELFLLAYPDYATWRREKPIAIESLEEFFRLVGQNKHRAEIDIHCQNYTSTEVYRWMLSFLNERTYLVDKTPAYANRTEILKASTQLDSFYIWLIRHPLAVIDSYLRLRSKRRTGAGLRARGRSFLERAERVLDRGLNRAARRREAKWVQQQINIGRFLTSVPNNQKHTICFEDLVTAPECSLRRLLGDLGLAFEPAMLYPFPRQIMKRGIGDQNFHTRSQIQPELALQWKQRFSEQSLRPQTSEVLKMLKVRRLE